MADEVNLSDQDLDAVAGGGSYEAYFDDTPRSCRRCGATFTPSNPGAVVCSRCYSTNSF